MHIDRRFVNWGVFLILLGGIPLLLRQGVLTEDAVSRLWTLWPLLLVAAGIGILLSRTAFHFVGGLLSAVVFGVIAGSVLGVGFGAIPFASCGDERGTTPFSARSGPLSGPSSVQIELNCGDLTAQTAAGGQWALEGSDETGRGPDVVAASNDLTIRSERRGTPFDFLGAKESWQVTLPQDVEMGLDVTLNAGPGRLDLAGAVLTSLDLNLNAGDVRIDLSTADVRSLDVEVNAGSARIDLPETTTSGSVSVNAGSINLCAAPGTAFRIQTDDNITSSNNFRAQGLTESDGTWQTPGYESAQVRIELDAEANAGGINLNPTGGCNG